MIQNILSQCIAKEREHGFIRIWVLLLLLFLAVLIVLSAYMQYSADAELNQVDGSQILALTDDEIEEIQAAFPEGLSQIREQVVLTAYQLLGKVSYFWGGKSLLIGWNSRWGVPMEVTAEGDASTGTVRPYGLDCSGFVDWVFYNVSGGVYVAGHGGEAAAQHSYCTDITWDEAQPGDLAFYKNDTHVGIVCGFDQDGSILIISCSSIADTVVVTGRQDYVSIGRPNLYSE